MFVFPPTVFVSNCLYDQITHLHAEIDEVALAYHGSGDINDLAAELCDVVHSAETALRILADRYGVDVVVVQAAVIEKNRVRGYYDAPAISDLAQALRDAGAHSCGKGVASLPPLPSTIKKESTSNSPIEETSNGN